MDDNKDLLSFSVEKFQQLFKLDYSEAEQIFKHVNDCNSGKNTFELDEFLEYTHTSESELVAYIAQDQISLGSLMWLCGNSVRYETCRTTNLLWAEIDSLDAQLEKLQKSSKSLTDSGIFCPNFTSVSCQTNLVDSTNSQHEQTDPSHFIAHQLSTVETIELTSQPSQIPEKTTFGFQTENVQISLQTVSCQTDNSHMKSEISVQTFDNNETGFEFENLKDSLQLSQEIIDKQNSLISDLNEVLKTYNNKHMKDQSCQVICSNSENQSDHLQNKLNETEITLAKTQQNLIVKTSSHRLISQELAQCQQKFSALNDLVKSLSEQLANSQNEISFLNHLVAQKHQENISLRRNIFKMQSGKSNTELCSGDFHKTFHSGSDGPPGEISESLSSYDSFLCNDSKTPFSDNSSKFKKNSQRGRLQKNFRKSNNFFRTPEQT